MLKIGVLYGGRSGEHDVSLCTAASIISALNPERYEVVAIGIDRDGKWYVQDKPVFADDKNFGKIMKLEKSGTWYVNHFDQNNKLVLHDIDSGKNVEVDVVFPAVHGTYCEDGTLQGLLEIAMVPFVGADTVGSSIAIDKDVSKRLLKDGDVPVVPWTVVTRNEWEKHHDAISEKIDSDPGFPLFVKPVCTGSSVGVKKAGNRDELDSAVDFAFTFDNKVMIEKCINAREIECAVLGNNEPESSIPGEVIPSHEFYSYESKYIDPDGAELCIPADINEKLSGLIMRTAEKAFKILNCSGMARVDFFLDKSSNELFLNEINTIPGFTRISMYPKLWEHSGMNYSSLIDRLIELALERHKLKMRIRTEINA